MGVKIAAINRSPARLPVAHGYAAYRGIRARSRAPSPAPPPAPLAQRRVPRTLSPVRVRCPVRVFARTTVPWRDTSLRYVRFFLWSWENRCAFSPLASDVERESQMRFGIIITLLWNCDKTCVIYLEIIISIIKNEKCKCVGSVFKSAWVKVNLQKCANIKRQTKKWIHI